MSKSFFVSSETEGRDPYAYNHDGRTVDFEVKEVLTPLMDKWIDVGYSPHELLAIVIRTLTSMMNHKILDYRRTREMNKIRRDADHIEEP